MKWLIAGFEPFDGAQSNSSEIVTRHLRTLDWGDKVRFHGPLPVSFKRAWPELERASLGVDGVLVFGQAESRAKISLECAALNWIDGRIADNDGNQPRLQKVALSGPDVLWSPIPWTKLGETEAWVRSYSAGVYVCNHVMYQTLEWAARYGRLGGFVHVPLLSSQADPQYQGLVRMQDGPALRAVESIVKFLVELEG